MKDTEREKTTAELAAWQMKRGKEADLTGQSGNQNKLKSGGKFKIGKFK